MADSTPKSYHLDPTLYLYTSLSSGSSSIITATSRMETILKAKKIPFQALDVATDEKARMLWGRRAGKRKLPGLVKQGMIVGDIEEVEEWNEYGELMDHLGDGVTKGQEPPTMMSASNTPTKPSLNPIPSALKEPPPTPADGSKAEIPQNEQLPSTPSSTAKPSQEKTLTTAMQNIGFEAAQKAKAAKSSNLKSSIDSSTTKESAEASPTLKKLDNAGPTGMPPPSGVTDAESAQALETAGADVVSKADDTPISSFTDEARSTEPSDSKEEGAAFAREISAKAEKAMAMSAGQAVAEAAPVEDSSIESAPAKKEEMVKVAQTTQDENSKPTEKVANATGEAETPISGTQTQEQPAAKAEAAEESVGD